jgi:predicted 2-oxoglutarate/Fe(II)-dependent dioxygenase YbiX
MIVKHYPLLDVYHVLNFFSEEEYSSMLDELEWLCDDELLFDPQASGGKEYVRTSRGLPIESLLKKEESDIIRCMDKIKTLAIEPDFTDATSTHLINHYMGGQEYGYHKDRCDYTAIAVFYPVPKPFEGGTLWFRKDDEELELEQLLTRDLVIFPGSLDHKVTRVKMLKENPCNMDARISVSRFIKL